MKVHLQQCYFHTGNHNMCGIDSIDTVTNQLKLLVCGNKNIFIFYMLRSN